MSKKRKITDFQFRSIILLIILLIVGLFYFGFLEDRFTVKEDSLGETQLITDHLSYQTEFCANRLTELAHEIHFLEREIKTEKEIIVEDEIIQEQEEEIVIIQQRQLEEVKAEFNKYEQQCNEFDQDPTTELCDQFLEEARNYLNIAQKNYIDSTGLEQFGIIAKDLRKANRIYTGLEEVCKNRE